MLIQKVLHRLYGVISGVVSRVSSILPLQDKIVFCRGYGYSFGEDPKYIALSILATRPDIKLIWLCNNKTTLLPKNIIAIKYASLTAIYHLCTAKIWVYSEKTAFKVQKRNGQFYLQTWHGTFGLKAVEQNAEDSLPASYIAESKRDSKMIDLMYSNSKMKAGWYMNGFWYSGPVIHSGQPQLSVTLKSSDYFKRRIFESLGILPEYKTILYAPTFRKDGRADSFVFDYDQIIRAMEMKFNNEFIMLVRMHPDNTEAATKIHWSKKMIDVTSFPDVHELVAISDILITDYSSLAFDMAISHRPVFILAQDYDSYINDDRPLMLPYEITPFFINKTEEELKNTITNFNAAKYICSVDNFLKTIGFEDDGLGDITIGNILIQVIDGKKDNFGCEYYRH